MKLIIYSGSDHKVKRNFSSFFFQKFTNGKFGININKEQKNPECTPLGKHTQQHRAECLQEMQPFEEKWDFWLLAK